jgi:hypothetical protein
MHSRYSYGAVNILAFPNIIREACLHDALLRSGAHGCGWLSLVSDSIGSLYRASVGGLC